MLKVEMEYTNKILIVRLKGNLLRNKVYKINNYLIPVLIKHKIENVVINLENLERIDEAGITALINTKWVMKVNKGKIKFCNLKLKDLVKRLKVRNLKSEEQAMKV